MRPTAFDPDLPVLPENATILTLDRLVSSLQSPVSSIHSARVDLGNDGSTASGDRCLKNI